MKKAKDKIKMQYEDELMEIKKIIESEIIKMGIVTIGKNFTNGLNYSKLNLFLENYLTIIPIRLSY